MCALRAHVAIWVVLGSFTPRSLLWDSDLSSIRVKMNLLTLTLGSRNYFHLESTLLRWSSTAPEDSEVTLRCYLETLCAPLLLFLTIENSLWMTTYTCHSYNHSLWPCYYKIPRIPLIIPRILWAYCLAVPCHMNTNVDNSSLLPSICSSHLIQVFHRSLRNTIRSFKNPHPTITLEILACLHYD